MLVIHKELKINNSFKNKSASNNILTFLTSNEYRDTNRLIEPSKVKRDDFICVEVFLENKSNVIVNNLAFNIPDTDILKFAKGSFTNLETKEAYVSISFTSNTFLIDNLGIDEKINFSFYLRVNVDSSDLDFKTIYNVLDFSNIPYIEDNTPINLFMIKQSALQITEDIARGIIKFENIGTNDIKNFIYRCSLPKDCNINMSHFKARLDNTPTRVYQKLYNRTLIFKIYNIPCTSSSKPSELILTLDTNMPNTIKITNLSVK